MKNIVVFGSSGAIGNALIDKLIYDYPQATIHAVGRRLVPFTEQKIISHSLNYHEEIEYANLANNIATNHPIDLLVIATGMLHDSELQPEKSINAVSAEKLNTLFQVNAVLPALIAKHFLVKLHKKQRAIFTVLSARVGSISDNHLGGWYAYRMSKAALNMLIKNLAIEEARKNKQTIVVGLHPGTVDSHLSQPFQRRVKKLFTPMACAENLLGVLAQLEPQQSGKCFAWDGQEVTP